jgi:hypothetical protein
MKNNVKYRNERNTSPVPKGPRQVSTRVVS